MSDQTEVPVPSVTVDNIQTPLADLPVRVQGQVKLLEEWKVDMEKQKMQAVKMEYAVVHLTERIVAAIRELRTPSEPSVASVLPETNAAAVN